MMSGLRIRSIHFNFVVSPSEKDHDESGDADDDALDESQVLLHRVNRRMGGRRKALRVADPFGPTTRSG